MMPLRYSIEISWPCACKQITSVRPSPCVYFSGQEELLWNVNHCLGMQESPFSSPNGTLTFFNPRVNSSHFLEISCYWFMLHATAKPNAGNCKRCSVKRFCLINVSEDFSIYEKCSRACCFSLCLGMEFLDFSPFLQRLMLGKSFSQFNLKPKKFILEETALQ